MNDLIKTRETCLALDITFDLADAVNKLRTYDRLVLCSNLLNLDDKSIYILKDKKY